MEEKMLPVPNEGHRRRQKQRQRRFPWGSIATVILVVAVCVYAFTLFGDKESPENYQENDTTTQGPDDVQGGLLDESSPQNTQTANDDTDWNLVLVNYENAIPENYEPKLVEVPGGEKVDERIYDPLSWRCWKQQRKEIGINCLWSYPVTARRKSSSSSMTTKWLDTAKREIPRAKRRNWQSNGYLFLDTVNIKLV